MPSNTLFSRVLSTIKELSFRRFSFVQILVFFSYVTVGWLAAVHGARLLNGLAEFRQNVERQVFGLIIHFVSFAASCASAMCCCARLGECVA